MKKRLSCIILTLVMIISLVPFAAAASDEATEAAEALYELGLFKGTGTNPNGTPIFDLDKTPTRNQAIIMLVRLLGKEEEAKAGTWKIPFTDVSDSMKPYIGYAYTNGLTNGYTATTYCGTNPIKANQYIAFVLRSLGYESGKDFEVSSSWKLSDKLGITNGQYENPSTFTRGDVAIISYKSLSCQKKTDPLENIPAETAVQKQNLQHFKSAFLSKTKFPITSKGLTLTWEQARALVGCDLETVKKNVRSLEDVLYYIVASDYSRSSGDLVVRGNEGGWHFNVSPTVALAKNQGNCGGTSGLVACLLEGDYDEVGMIGMTSAMKIGGHVANYIKDGDTYLAFDVNQFAGGYEFSLNLSKSNDLNEAVLKSFGGNRGEKTRKTIFTYTGCYDGDAPIVLPYGTPVVYLIEGYGKNINIVRETPEEGYVFEFVTVSQEILDAITELRNKL